MGTSFGVMEPENLGKPHGILKLVGRSAAKMFKFSRWRDFNALRCLRVLLQCDGGSAEE